MERSRRKNARRLPRGRGMRIGINASALAHERTGVARYTAGFLEAFRKREEAREAVLFYNYFRRWGGDKKTGPPDFGMKTRIRRIPEWLLRRCWNSLNAPTVEQLIGAVDIYHNLAFFGMPQRSGKQVSTVHDLLFLRFPDMFTDDIRNSLTEAVTDAVKRADFLITVSKAARSDLVELLDVPAEMTRVIYEAASPVFKPVDDGDRVRSVLDRYAIQKDYFMFLGAAEPRKNLPFLLEAYGNLDKGIRKDYCLVISGPARWGGGSITDKIREYGIKEDVVMTGYVSDYDAASLYGGARAFVFPSLGEGFGLPVLEAMSCGTPVICSNASSMPEIAGDAAYLIDPTDVESLVKAMTRLADDDTLFEDLKTKGLERSGVFSWDKNVSETLEVYKDLLEGRVG